MKKWFLACLIVLTCSVSYAESLVNDNFNSYANGSIVGQGGWEDYAGGHHFIVQETTVFEGNKALYNNTALDSVIGKKGTLLTDGEQSVYVRTENRNTWSNTTDLALLVRITKGLWGAPNASVSFKSDGHVYYYDQNFATYNDKEWTLLDMEWRSVDATARCRINTGTWTDWKPITLEGKPFTGFDYVGFDFDPRGAGGVYFDTLRSSVPEPSTWLLLIIALITGALFLRKK